MELLAYVLIGSATTIAGGLVVVLMSNDKTLEAMGAIVTCLSLIPFFASVAAMIG